MTTLKQHSTNPINNCQQCIFGTFIYHSPSFYQTQAHLLNATYLLDKLQQSQIHSTIAIDYVELEQTIHHITQLHQNIQKIIETLIK